MTEDLEKKEILEPAHQPDKLTRTESIKTNEQNQDHAQALASNPDQFPSIANLSIPNKDQIEPFQIIDDGKTIAASRKIELAEPAGNSSFHEGLKALPEEATPEQLAQYQTDYILRKAASIEAAGTMPAIPTSLMLEGRAEKNQTSQETNEYFERMAGFLIGSVQGIGSVAEGLAHIADFIAYCLIFDHKRAGEKVHQFSDGLTKTLHAGVRLFQSSYDYLYDVGFEGDYSKPFSDIASLAVILNDRWQQLPPREQERRKAELISQLIAGGFVGMAGAQSLGKAKTYSELLDGIAATGFERTSQTTKKIAETIGRQVDDLLQPEYALPGGGKIKMKDLPRVTKDDLYNAMAEGKGKAYRGDHDIYSRFNEKGRLKSYVDENGDLVPVNPSGLYKGRKVTPAEHLNASWCKAQKANSPYTSFSVENGQLVTKYGGQRIELDLPALEAELAAGKSPVVAIHRTEDIVKSIIEHPTFPAHTKEFFINCARKDNEILIEGIIPKRFLKIEQ